MSRLAPAHRGYEYQDILVACRLVDVLLGTIVEARCDEKLFDDDRFDDLTTIDIAHRRERSQFKHTENDDRPLTLESFTADTRRLRLDRLIAGILTDRAGPGAGALDVVYRIVLRDGAPVDSRLAAVLKPTGVEAGPFVPGMRTQRLGFDAAALWAQRDGEASKERPFASLFSADGTPTYDEFEWACGHLVVEVEAPRASLDLSDPDVAEQLLLARVRSDVGAEVFPNTDRTGIDVAAAIVSAARAARQGLLDPTAEELLRRAQLRSDFGAVARSHPVDPTVEVSRPATVGELVEAASGCARDGRTLLVVGPPGHGKSWIAQQVLAVLAEQGWLVAEHYCYLGDADGERTSRVLAEAIFGSLVGRLAEDDPRLVLEQRPRFAADEDALEACLHRSLSLDPDRRVALVVDGIDHITRIRAGRGGSFDPSRSLSEALASLDLPQGVVVIVLSQPGSHLGPLEEAGAETVTLPGLTEREIHLLAGRLGLVPTDGAEMSTEPQPILDDPESRAAFLEALTERSAGNALYATYLCREALRSIESSADAAAIVLHLPPFDGTLKSYYDHLYQSLGTEAGWVADVIALVDFAVTRAELREIRPDAAHRVDRALEVLQPVLIERATQGGLRVYHESFAGYLRMPFQDDASTVASLLDRITNWLATKGMFVDDRAFRSLLSLLAEAREDERVLGYVDAKFVTDAVAAAFPVSAIRANLATAVGAAGRLGDWPSIVRYVEMSRAAESYQAERFDSTLVAFADVPAALLGADTVANRLLDEDRLVMPARAGLQMCAAVDSLGATAPWRAYMVGFLREAETDNTSYGEESDREVEVAWIRGRLRLASGGSAQPSTVGTTQPPSRQDDDIAGGDEAEWDPAGPIDWGRLSEELDGGRLPIADLVGAVLDTQGWDGLTRLVRSLEHPGQACLAIAERLAAGTEPSTEIKSPKVWAIAAAAHGTRPGSLRRILALGVDPSDLDTEPVDYERDRLLDLTRAVQERSIRWEDGRLPAWLDAAALAAHRDPLGLSAADSLIVGEGWYRCWLRFVLGLCRAEAATSTERGALALESLGVLSGDLRPFAGDPRACDLYPLHPVIADTIERAMAMLDDEQWSEGLRVLAEVSAAITTTLFGELGGPVPPDFVLRLAVVQGASAARRRVAEELIADEIAKGSGRRFYSDLAEYRLLAARLALASDDRAAAEALWHEACVFLTAYGWHKDITIYEVLDPLPALIDADPAAARLRIASAQAFCERIPLHTDLRETSHAWSRWWSLLAKADPVAATKLAAPELLGECNDPNWLLNEALEDVWREWHEHVDALVAGALRLTLDTPLDPADATQLQRLANHPAQRDAAAGRLLTWLLARADERPVSYSFTNSDELIARDDVEVARLNAVAEAAGAPSVSALCEEPIPDASGSRWDAAAPMPRTLGEPEMAQYADGFPTGLPGLTKAIRAWRSRSYDTRFVNVIGYRLLELLADGRTDDATFALELLADSAGFGDGSAMLRSIGEGLERHGETQLAALAYALAWTRTRGHGGWLTFGGESEIESLHRATALDAPTANAAVAEEIERIVATSRYGIYGISQALIYALVVGALTSSEHSAASAAFAAWDEAAGVIESRAPRVDASDDPDLPYVCPDPDGGERAPGDVEGAFALAAVAGLAHPGREKKRRALVATQVLLEERPAVVAPAIAVALRTTSDPATLTWLLSVLDSLSARSRDVVNVCQPELRELARRDLLTIRALARRMVAGESPPLIPPAAADPGLVGPMSEALWTPAQPEDDGDDSHPPGLDELLKSVAGRRIRRGKRFLSGLEEAVRARAASTLDSDALKRRLDRQLDSFGDRINKRWPDAFLAPEESIEMILQSVAGGGRAALIMAGEPVSDPVRWEDDLAAAIVDEPTVPLTLEARRQPRPRVPPPLRDQDPVWRQIRDQAQGGSSQEVEEAFEDSGVLLATFALEPVSALPTVERGPFHEWYWLGTRETRIVKPRDGRSDDELFSRRYRMLEVRDTGDRQALRSPPVASGDLRFWGVDIGLPIGAAALGSSQPLIGIDDDLKMVGDGLQGLGVAGDALLVPTSSLIAALGLSPGGPWSQDEEGSAGLALVTWRAEYDVSDHYLARPRTVGSGIVIRPDLLDKLGAAAGEDRLILRDFVAGRSRLAGDASEVAADAPATGQPGS